MTRQVFISHSAGDREAAEAIRAALEAQALSCWIAPRDIPPGAEWAAAIMAGITEARVMVLVHSAASAASQMVLREVNVAVDSRKPVIPVRIDATLPQNGMQFYLGSTHWLDASAGPLAEQLPRIVAAVADQLGADRPQPGPGAIGAAPHRGPGGGPAPTKRHRVWIGAAVAIVGIVGAASAWWVIGGPAPPPRPASDTSPAAARAS